MNIELLCVCVCLNIYVHLQESHSPLHKKLTSHNIHIDHIKPIHAFNLDNEDEFNECANYTNLQPLLKEDNLRKAARWSAVGEEYRIKHIKDNAEYDGTYIPR